MAGIDDVESEFYYLAAQFGALPPYDYDEEEAEIEDPGIDWRVALFYATYLTATAAGYYYIGRAAWRALRGSS